MKKKRCRDGVTCVVICVACTLPSIYLVCVVFGTAAIPTSLNIFGKCFSYLCILMCKTNKCEKHFPMNVNVTGMNYPVRYSKETTLAQEVLEWLSLPTPK